MKQFGLLLADLVFKADGGRFRAVALLLSVGLSLCRPALAHGEIAYGARYYLPPSASGTSHSHIYRIDPDGRDRVQLTFGNSDDVGPVWTDGGRTIAFYRTVNPSGDRYLMTVGAGGGPAHKVRMIRFADDPLGQDVKNLEAPPNLSPDKMYLCQPRADGDGDDIVDVSTHKTVGKLPIYGPVLWLSDSTFAAVGRLDNGTFRYTVYDLSGEPTRSVMLADMTSHDALHNAEVSWASAFPWTSAYRPDPDVPGTYFVALDAKLTMLYWFDPGRRVIRLVTSAYVEGWAPNRQSFCTCLIRQTSPYLRRADGSEETVWTSFLAVVDVKTFGVDVLAGGLVDCDGADWLGGTRSYEGPY